MEEENFHNRLKVGDRRLDVQLKFNISLGLYSLRLLGPSGGRISLLFTTQGFSVGCLRFLLLGGISVREIRNHSLVITKILSKPSRSPSKRISSEVLREGSS
ncbi:CHAT domain-containing protein [Sesbania bispinosa]|nr:CHAT domain-containing protein [Sesbania bispinosa]